MAVTVGKPPSWEVMIPNNTSEILIRQRNSTEQKQEITYKRRSFKVNPEVIRDSDQLETFKKTLNPNLGPEKK